MAVKWHVNGEKKPGECSARKGQCPFGADAPHYGSEREAQAAAEGLIAREAAGFGGEAKASVLAECEGGSGLAVDAAGRWYRDGALVESMVEAVGDAGEPVMITDDEFCGSVVSNAETDVRIHAGRINDLVNVGCDANHGDGMNMSMIGGDVTVERAFGVSVGYVGDDAHIGLLTGHRGPGDDSPFGVLSQVDDMLGDASVGKVRGRASMMRDRSHVDDVMDGGFVEEVHDDASVDSVTFRGRVKGVYEGGRVALVDAGGVVEHVSGSARRLRGFWRSR